MANPITSFFAGLIKPASDAFQARTQRKQAEESAKAKLALARQEGAQGLTMTDAEWEAIGQRLQGESWKDEYVTVSFVSIVNFVIIGAVLKAFGYPLLLDGMLDAIVRLKTDLELDMNFLITAIVLAAVGLKVWRQS